MFRKSINQIFLKELRIEFWQRYGIIPTPAQLIEIQNRKSRFGEVNL